MILRAIERADLPLTIQWRNEPQARAGLRTPFPLNLDQQEQFFRDVICNRNSPHRYWILDDHGPVGMTGLTNISWENRIAEISLITDPQRRRQHYGSMATQLVLREAFLHLGLLTVCGEVYRSNPAVVFWEKMIQRFAGEAVTLPRRKWWNGTLHDSVYFTFIAERTLPLVTEDEAA